MATKPSTLFPIIVANTGSDYFEIAGDHVEQFFNGLPIVVTGTNAGNYTVNYAALSGPNTQVFINEAVPTSTADGTLSYNALPQWATGVSALVTEPSSGKKGFGYQNLEYPPADFDNWFQRLIYLWVKWVNEEAVDKGTAQTITATKTFAAKQIVDEVLQLLGKTEAASPTIVGSVRSKIISAMGNNVADTDKSRVTFAVLEDDAGEVHYYIGINCAANFIKGGIPEVSAGYDTGIFDYSAANPQVFAVRIAVSNNNASLSLYHHTVGAIVDGTLIPLNVTFSIGLFSGLFEASLAAGFVPSLYDHIANKKYVDTRSGKVVVVGNDLSNNVETFDIPDNVTFISVTSVGAGGGGGQGGSGAGGGGGGGGGAGTAMIELLLPVTPGETITITAARRTAPVTNGNASTVAGSFGTVSADGGLSGGIGGGGPNGAGGAAGIGGQSDYRDEFDGNAGLTGDPGVGVVGGSGDRGGNSWFGRNGAGGAAETVGSDATGYGAGGGGGGGDSGTGAGDGGRGSRGFVTVEWGTTL